jgi:hypothetical protein
MRRGNRHRLQCFGVEPRIAMAQAGKAQHANIAVDDGKLDRAIGRSRRNVTPLGRIRDAR